jgi:hypothetical protein
LPCDDSTTAFGQSDRDVGDVLALDATSAGVLVAEGWAVEEERAAQTSAARRPALKAADGL